MISFQTKPESFHTKYEGKSEIKNRICETYIKISQDNKRSLIIGWDRKPLTCHYTWSFIIFYKYYLKFTRRTTLTSKNLSQTLIRVNILSQ